MACASVCKAYSIDSTLSTCSQAPTHHTPPGPRLPLFPLGIVTMVKNIRVTYRRRHSYNTKSNRIRVVKTPGKYIATQPWLWVHVHVCACIMCACGLGSAFCGSVVSWCCMPCVFCIRGGGGGLCVWECLCLWSSSTNDQAAMRIEPLTCLSSFVCATTSLSLPSHTRRQACGSVPDQVL